MIMWLPHSIPAGMSTAPTPPPPTPTRVGTGMSSHLNLLNSSYHNYYYFTISVKRHEWESSAERCHNWWDDGGLSRATEWQWKLTDDVWPCYNYASMHLLLLKSLSQSHICQCHFSLWGSSFATSWECKPLGVEISVPLSYFLIFSSSSYFVNVQELAATRSSL